MKRGKTPVLKADQARTLLDSIETDTIVGLRDRALLGLMCFTFARVSAAIHMRVEDYYQNGKRWWFRLHEKGGKRHEVPAHRNAEAYMDAYLATAGISDEKKGPSFAASTSTARLTANPMTQDRRAPHDQTPRLGCRTPLLHLLSHLPGHRNHRVS